MSSMKFDSLLRIAIIGAGPAGLSAAERLREKGYKNVTVLEKRDRVGGQSLSGTYTTPTNQKIIYDLGSIQPVSTSSGVTNKLLKRYDIHLGRGVNGKKPMLMKLYMPHTKTYLLDYTKYLLGFPLTLKNIGKTLHDLFILSKNLFKYRALAKPGYDALNPKYRKELSIPSDEWIDNLNLRILGEPIKFFLESVLTFVNASYVKDISAMNGLKLIYPLIRLPHRYLDGTIMQIREGYQELWNRVAAANHVKLNTIITKIDRKVNCIDIHTTTETLQFDKIIFACPAYEILHMLDESYEEHDILSKIEYTPGWRAFFTAQNMPHDAAYFMPYSLIHPNTEMIAAFLPEGQIDEKTWGYEAVISSLKENHAHPPLEASEKILKEHFNATNIQWIKTAYWQEYGSHFNRQLMGEGFYEKLTALQGNNNTYFTGEILSCGLHALVSNYSYYFVDKYF